VARHIAAPDSLVGRTIGRRYEIVALVAKGGMAIVYRAHDRQLDRQVAVKVPRAEFARDRGFSEQFRREARAAARLSHPSMVAVYDSGEERGLPWIVMEYVPGQTLREVLDARGRLDLATTAELLGPVADALDHAHRAGVVHLDVKPENILLTSDSVKVTDFGLVRAARGGRAHAPAGTVQYCAPETLRGGMVDGRADVYALGVVAFECVTGRPPFNGTTTDQLVRQVLNERVPPPSVWARELPETADQAVRRATDPDPASRFHASTEFTAAIGAPRRRRVDETLRATTVLPTPAQSQAQGPAPAISAAVSGMEGRAPSVTPASAAARETVAAMPLTAPPLRRRHQRQLRPSSARLPRSRRPKRQWTRGTVLLALTLAVLLTVGIGGGWLLAGPTRRVPSLVGMGFDQAVASLNAHRLRFVEDPPTGSPTIREGLVAAQSPGPGKWVHRLAVIHLRRSIGVTMPSLAGQSEAAAEAALTARGLHWTTTQEPSISIPAGAVKATDPTAGTPIRDGQQVTLIISSGKPHTQVPVVRGQAADAAAAALGQAHLKSQQIQVFDDNVPLGFAIGTNPPTGTDALWGDLVTLQISKGPDLVVVPDVRGLPRQRAVQLLRQAGLKASFTLGLGGTVIDQNPPANTKLKRGSTVKLLVRFF